MACRGSSRECRFPQAPASPAAASSRAPPGSRSRSTAAPTSARTPSTTGSRRLPRSRRRRSACSSRSSSPAGSTRSRCSSRPATRPTTRSGRPWRSRRASGRPFTEDSRLRWHPAASGIATLHGEGKVSVLPAIGYANSDKSHFTSRHYWEVGATDANLRTGWMGRYLDAIGTPDNPLQGLSLDVALQPALATAKVPVATLQAADQYTLRHAGPPGASARVVDHRGVGEHRRRAREVDRRRAEAGGQDRASSRTLSTSSSARSATASRARSRIRRRPIRSRTGSPASRR